MTHPVDHLRWDSVCTNHEQLHIARVLASQKGSTRLHRHDFYECFLVEGGDGWHQLPGGRERLNVSELIFVRPEHTHGFASLVNAHPLRFVNIAIPASVVEGFQRRNREALPDAAWNPEGEKPAVIQLSPGQMLEMRKLLEVLASGDRRGVDAEWFLGSLSRLLHPGVFEQPGPETPLWLRDGLLQMRQPRNLREGLPRLVALCGKSPEHIARLMRTHTQRRPSEWINGQRLHYAARLLETSDLSVTEVAQECGMENLSHFHRCFKQAYGTTPKQYRKSHLVVA